jgi:hypothetical protein
MTKTIVAKSHTGVCASYLQMPGRPHLRDHQPGWHAEPQMLSLEIASTVWAKIDKSTYLLLNSSDLTATYLDLHFGADYIFIVIKSRWWVQPGVPTYVAKCLSTTSPS